MFVKSKDFKKCSDCSVLFSATDELCNRSLPHFGIFAVLGRLDREIIEAAIKIYEQIIEDGSAQRTHIAQAMYRLGTCYLKQQNEQRAKMVFSRLVAEYPEETSIIEKVQSLLEPMQAA